MEKGQQTAAELWLLGEIVRNTQLCFKYQVLWLRSRFFYRLSNELSGNLYSNYPVASISEAADLLLSKAGYKAMSVQVPVRRMPIAESTITFKKFTTGFLPYGKPVWMDKGYGDVGVKKLARQLGVSEIGAARYLLHKIREA